MHGPLRVRKGLKVRKTIEAKCDKAYELGVNVKNTHFDILISFYNLRIFIPPRI